jgi:hypothetical protein
MREKINEWIKKDREAVVNFIANLSMDRKKEDVISIVLPDFKQEEIKRDGMA